MSYSPTRLCSSSNVIHMPESFTGLNPWWGLLGKWSQCLELAWQSEINSLAVRKPGFFFQGLDLMCGMGKTVLLLRDCSSLNVRPSQTCLVMIWAERCLLLCEKYHWSQLWTKGHITSQPQTTLQYFLPDSTEKVTEEGNKDCCAKENLICLGN